MYIQSTTDYSLFKLENNRDIDARHVEALIRSIGLHDHTPSHPISVKRTDGMLWVFDGQHRYLACVSLGIPIHYVIDEQASSDALLTIQISKKWTQMDRLAHLAKTSPDHAELKGYLDDLRLGSAGIRMLAMGADNTVSIETIPKRMKAIRMNYHALMRIRQGCPTMATKRLLTNYRPLTSIIYLLNLGCDINRLIDRINDAGDTVQVVSDVMFMRASLLKFYNYGLHRDSRIHDLQGAQ